MSPGATAQYHLIVRGLLSELEREVFDSLERAGYRFDALEDDILIRLAGLPVGVNLFGRLGAVTATQKRATEEQIKRLGLPQRDDPTISALLDQWRSEQLAKITALTGREVRKLGAILVENEGMHPGDLKLVIQERLRVTKSKADLLARDQTITLSTRLSQRKMEDAGVTEYIWTTADDERVRGNPDGLWPHGLHFQLEGKRFKFSGPPIMSPDGRRGNPGDDYQCRCVAFPVMAEFDS